MPTLHRTSVVANRSTMSPAICMRNLYVAPGGDDSANGSSMHPWQSIQRAVDSALDTAADRRVDQRHALGLQAVGDQLGDSRTGGRQIDYDA